MSKVKKAILVLDEMPSNCLECPFRHKSETIPLGDFTFKQLFICRCQPEDVEDYYLDNSKICETKPDWCPLIEVED